MRNHLQWMVIATLLLFALGFTGVSTPVSAGGHQWWTLETAHFLVHYPSGYEDVAGLIADLAEEAHTALVPRVGYAPAVPTHILVLDEADMSNAWANPTLINRIGVIPIAASDFGYAGGMVPDVEDRLRVLIYHEYTHILHMDMHEGGTSFFRRLFGKVPGYATPNALQGYMFLEGYAVLLETQAAGGNRGDGAMFDMFLRADVLEDRMLRADQALGQYSLERWQPAGTIYLYGHGFLNYLSERFGEEALVQVNRDFAHSPRLIGETIRRVLGVPLETLWQDWGDYLQARYAAQAEILGVQAFTEPEPLPSGGYVPQNPVYSPDGRWIAYGSIHGEVFPGIRLTLADGGGDQHLVSGFPFHQLAWLPEGDGLVYGQLEYDGRGRLFSDLYTYDLESGRQIRLTEGERAFAPAVSPQGDGIAYIKRDAVETRVMLLDRKTGDTRVLLGPEHGLDFLSLAWAPDGASLAVGANVPGKAPHILLMEDAGETLRPLTDGVATDVQPAWTPDGRYLLFASDRTGVYNLYALDLEDGETQKVTNMLYGAFHPTVAPDGSTIVFMDYTVDGYRLATLPLDPDTWMPADGRINGRIGADTTDPIVPQAEMAVTNAKIPQVGLDVANHHGSAVERSGVAGITRSYNPLPSLLPKWWLPLSGQDEGGSQIGLVTSGMDALGLFEYSGRVAWGTQSGRWAYDLVGTARVAPDSPVSLRLNAHDWPIRRFFGAQVGWFQQAGAGAQVIWRQPRLFTDTQVAVGVESQQRTPLSGVGTDTAETRVVAQLGRASVTGSDHLRQTRRTILTLAQGLDEQPPSRRVVYRRNEAFRWGARGVTTMTHLGWSQRSEDFVLGGHEGNWAVRGFPRGSQRGSHAIRLAVEWEERLATIERGMGSWPVFFQHVNAVPFVDAGWAWDDQPDPASVSVGVEARLQMQLQYGRQPGSLLVGVAKPVSEPALPWKWYLGIDMGF